MTVKEVEDKLAEHAKVQGHANAFWSIEFNRLRHGVGGLASDKWCVNYWEGHSCPLKTGDGPTLETAVDKLYRVVVDVDAQLPVA